MNVDELRALIARVKELDKAATPGPWGYAYAQAANVADTYNGFVCTLIADDVYLQPRYEDTSHGPDFKDYALAVEYRTAAPQLADAYLELHARAQKLRDVLLAYSEAHEYLLEFTGRPLTSGGTDNLASKAIQEFDGAHYDQQAWECLEKIEAARNK